MILWKLCIGLYWLHYRYVAHVDLKPDNVLCNTSGEVAITDFGLSKQIFPHVENIRSNYDKIVQTFGLSITRSVIRYEL